MLLVLTPRDSTLRESRPAFAGPKNGHVRQRSLIRPVAQFPGM
jgi:hypothetical protein